MGDKNSPQKSYPRPLVFSWEGKPKKGDIWRNLLGFRVSGSNPSKKGVRKGQNQGVIGGGKNDKQYYK